MARELLAADRKLQEAGDVVSLRKAGALFWTCPACCLSRGAVAARCRVLLPTHHADLTLPARGSRARLVPAAIQYVLAIAGRVEGILEGSPLIDPMQYGWTTDEERSAATGGNVRLQGAGRQAPPLLGM